MNARVKRSAKLMQHAPTQKVHLTAIVTLVSEKKRELARMKTNAWKRRITVTRKQTVKMCMGHFHAIAMRASAGTAFIVLVRKLLTLFNQTLYSHFSLARTISGKEKIRYYRELLVSEK